MNGFVYFARSINATGPVKIGFSMDAQKRLPELAHWCPEPMELILTISGDQKLERNIHNCFADDHYHHEWFHFSARLERAVRQMQGGAPVHKAIDLTDIRGNVLAKAAEATRKRNGSPSPWESRRANAIKRSQAQEATA